MNVINKQIENIDTNSFVKIIKGSIFSIILTIILLVGISLLLAYTDVSESIMTPSVIIVSGISILLGSLISVKRIRRNGILNGGVVGLIYILTLYFLSSLIQRDFGLSINSIIMITISILTGCLGGIIGVNVRKK